MRFCRSNQSNQIFEIECILTARRAVYSSAVSTTHRLDCPLPMPSVRKTKTKDYAIRFMEPDGKSAYYLVAFTRRLVYYSKTFAPAAHGGKRAALAAAKQWRDLMLAGLPPITKQEYARQVRSSNTSGVPGVMRLNLRQESSRGNWRSYPTWVAVTPKGVRPRKSKSFSILRYGERRAFELACAAREGFVRMASGYWAQGVPEEFLPDAQGKPNRRLKRCE